MISNNKSPVNEFSPELWEQLSKRLAVAAGTASERRIAAFDADGTPWDADAGETFFDWQIKNAALDIPADPWAHYNGLKAVDPIAAYVWLAQINAGQMLSQVRTWAQTCFKEKIKELTNWPVFPSQVLLLDLLRTLNFEIFIVTASVKWAVEPVARLVGIDDDHVIGITTKIEDGIVGSEPVHPVTWRHGKAEGLLGATGGIRPIIACGNTYGDTALLETATHVQLAVSTQDAPNGLFEEEQKLAIEAQTRGWFQHEFRPVRGRSF